MSVFEKKRSGSLFKRYFIQITATVLFCLTVTSLTVLLFSVSVWKKNRLALLKDDALSLVQSVSSVLSEAFAEVDSDGKGAELTVNRLISAVAKSSGTDIYITGEDGKVLMSAKNCVDNGFAHTRVFAPETEGLPLSDELLEDFRQAENGVFEYKGKLSDLSKEDCFVVSVPLSLKDTAGHLVMLQSESVALLPYTTVFLRIYFFVGIIAVFISFIISMAISFRMTKPLKRIIEATNHYANGDFSVRIRASDLYDELSELVDAVNKMADSLEGLDESRNSFVANISHELKTPMTTISGFIDGILDGTVSHEDREKYLTIVSDEVKRLSRLVVAMLNMSKIEAGKLKLNKTNCDLSGLLAKTLLGFEKLINDADISVVNGMPPEPLIVFADEPLINQVIYNLLDNAVKFTPRGGTITLALRREKKNAVFSVRNTGKGISPEDRSFIFDRFFKADKSRGLDAQSFGMGLYIVKSIIELHKGTIDINSEPGVFTDFTVRLPLQ